MFFSFSVNAIYASHIAIANLHRIDFAIEYGPQETAYIKRGLAPTRGTINAEIEYHLEVVHEAINACFGPFHSPFLTRLPLFMLIFPLEMRKTRENPSISSNTILTVNFFFPFIYII